MVVRPMLAKYFRGRRRGRSFYFRIRGMGWRKKRGNDAARRHGSRSKPQRRNRGRTLRSSLLVGNAAVCVFFVLSGYVLTDLSQRSELTFPAQALRRHVRLVGPILLTSTFAWALSCAR